MFDTLVVGKCVILPILYASLFLVPCNAYKLSAQHLSQSPHLQKYTWPVKQESASIRIANAFTFMVMPSIFSMKNMHCVGTMHPEIDSYIPL